MGGCQKVCTRGVKTIFVILLWRAVTIPLLLRAHNLSSPWIFLSLSLSLSLSLHHLSVRETTEKVPSSPPNADHTVVAPKIWSFVSADPMSPCEASVR